MIENNIDEILPKISKTSTILDKKKFNFNNFIFNTNITNMEKYSIDNII